MTTTIDIDRILEHLDTELIQAMGDALNAVAPNSQIDPRALFLAFVKAADRWCSSWERVPDRCVDVR